MPHTIRVRDVARNGKYELGPNEPVLLVPYDLFQPAGAVHRRGDLVDWRQGDNVKSGRAVEELLGQAQPGQRVLVKIDAAKAAQAIKKGKSGEASPAGSGENDEWWLCEIEAVNGVDGAGS